MTYDCFMINIKVHTYIKNRFFKHYGVIRLKNSASIAVWNEIRLFTANTAQI